MQTTTNYGEKRLKKLFLDSHPNFSACTRTGRIFISYSQLNGLPLLYEPIEDNRRTLAIEQEQFKPFKVIRNPPEWIKLYNLPKYSSPKKGGTPPFFTPEILQAFNRKKLDVLIFTEGEIKAAIASKLLGIPTIGFKGIACYRLCFRLKELLSETLPQIIIINYDSDSLDHKSKKRLAQFHASCAQFIAEIRRFYKSIGAEEPTIYINCQNPKQQHKGLDDLLLNVEDSAIEYGFLENSNNFLFSKVDQEKPIQTVNEFFNFRSRKQEALFNAHKVLRASYLDDCGNRNYLSDILEINNFPLKGFFGKCWNVPTGFGKSTTTLQAAIKTKERIVFVLPTRSLVDQLYRKAKKMGLDAAKFYGTAATGSKQKLFERLTANDAPTAIFTTYKSFKGLFKTLTSVDINLPSTYNLIQDEIHNNTTSASASFQLGELNDILDLSHRFKTFTGLTASPLPVIHPVLQAMEVIKLRISGLPKPKCQIVTAKNLKAAGAEAIKRAIKQGSIPVVLLNNKSLGLEILLNELGKYADNLILLNADTKNEQEQQELINTGLLNGKKGIIATTVLKEGISLLDKANYQFIQIGIFHNSTSYQFSQRARLATQSQLTIIVSDKISKRKKSFLDVERTLSDLSTQAQQICDMQPIYGAALDIRDTIQNTHIRKVGSDFNPVFIPNYLGIQHHVFCIETSCQYSCLNSLRIALSKYFKVLDQEPKLNKDTSAETKALAKASRENKKAIEEQQFNEAVQLLSDAREKRKLAQHGQCDNIHLKRFLDILELQNNPDKALKILIWTSGKKKVFKLAMARLKAKKANFNGLGILGNAPVSIKRKFRAGKLYTKDQVREKILDALSTDSTINLAPYKYAKRLDKFVFLLKLFFEVERTGTNRSKYALKPLIDCF